MKNSQSLSTLFSLLGVKYDGKMLRFPNEDSFTSYLEHHGGSPGRINNDFPPQEHPGGLTIKDDVLIGRTIKDDVWAGRFVTEDHVMLGNVLDTNNSENHFWSMNHELAFVEQQRYESWKAGKLKENEKSEPVIAKFPAGEALRSLLNAEGKVGIEGKIYQFTASGEVLCYDEKGKLITEKKDQTTGGPKSLCCIRNFSQTQVQSINATDRLIAKHTVYHVPFFSPRFYFAAESVYQRFVAHPTLGNIWFNCNTSRIGVVMFGGYRIKCSDDSPIISIPGQVDSRVNYYRASVSYLTGTLPNSARVGRFASTHGAPPTPGFNMYAC
jgi:hypothetical protein